MTKEYTGPTKEYTGPYAVGELITDSEGRKVVAYSILPSSEKYKDWKIKSASSLGNNKSAGMDCQRATKLSSQHKMISNRQTKAASSPSDTVQVDFHTDATYSNRIPTRPYIVDDRNRKYYKAEAEREKQKRENERFQKQVEEMRLAKKLQMLQDVYIRKGIVI
jgi:hypothetical protein